MSTKQTAGETEAPENYCTNCASSPHGRYCQECGQALVMLGAQASLLRPGVVEAYWQIYDRALLTFADLCKPGRVAANYLAGRRVRYVPPLRLFGLLSVLAFMLAQLAVATEENGTQLKVGGAAIIRVNTVEEVDSAAQVQSSSALTFSAPEFREPFKLPAIQDHVWFNIVGERIDAELSRFDHDPRSIILAIIRAMPSVILLMIPIFALLLKLAHFGSGWRYLEHLVVVIYSHAFICLVLSFTFFLSSVANVLTWLEPTVAWVTAALWLWVPIYLLLTQKHVYMCSWALTIARYLVIGIAHLVIATATATLFAFVSLVL